MAEKLVETLLHFGPDPLNSDHRTASRHQIGLVVPQPRADDSLDGPLFAEAKKLIAPQF